MAVCHTIASVSFTANQSGTISMKVGDSLDVDGIYQSNGDEAEACLWNMNWTVVVNGGNPSSFAAAFNVAQNTTQTEAYVPSVAGTHVLSGNITGSTENPPVDAVQHDSTDTITLQVWKEKVKTSVAWDEKNKAGDPG